MLSTPPLTANEVSVKRTRVHGEILVVPKLAVMLTDISSSMMSAWLDGLCAKEMTAASRKAAERNTFSTSGVEQCVIDDGGVRVDREGDYK
ncbi:MAG: hypothetical protein IPG43_24405 [Proteobacteria bacterium]|nr:hypothetical protein [Pseudomonadota bacterium]